MSGKGGIYYMKMIYIFNHPVIEEQHIGIRKKINMQMKAFYKKGYIPILIVTDEFRVFIQNKTMNENRIEYFQNPKNCYDYILDFLKKENADLIYMRHPILKNHFMFDFYETLGREMKACKLIYEFYTYPYDYEFDEKNEMIQIDRYYREQLKKFIPLSTNYTGDREILGIPSIAIANGIDTDIIQIKKGRQLRDNKINLVGIGNLSFWHGYDRLLEGMHAYYSQKNTEREYEVYFHIIGEGPESFHLQDLTKKYGLENYVTFYGKIIDEKKIKGIMEEMDIGVGPLGCFRKKIYNATPIKVTEFCARGLPIIREKYQDIYMDKKFPYQMLVSQTDDSIDINKVIRFYVMYGSTEISQKIREYAENNLTWDKMIDKILIH